MHRSEEVKLILGNKHVYTTMVVSSDRDGHECVTVGRQQLQVHRDEDQRLYLRFDEERAA